MIKKRTVKSFMLLLASFALPFLIIVVALIGLRITPFGDKTLVISDGNGLYINYLGYAGRLFKGLEDAVYSFEKGLGGNMMPHINGTVLNPTFILAALTDITNYPLMYTWISVLNFAICGLTMYILLADLYGHVQSNLIFSTTYALCGFMVVNAFQIIFYAGVQALPLMVLGLKRIIEGKNPLLYILSLAYTIATSSYFGFTLCVASVLLFFTTLWRDNELLRGRRMSLFVNYAVASLCGGLLVIFIWLPAFMGIMGGRLDKTSIWDFSFSERMPFVDILAKLFTGSNTKEQLQAGLPNIFVGLLPVALVALYFMNRKIDRRDKIRAGSCLSFYFVCFYIMAFDMLMHGGTTPNWFNHRYSYIFSFFLLLVAAREWQFMDEIPFEDIRRCFIGMLLVTFFIFSKKYEFVIGGEMVLDYCLLLLIYLGYRMYRLKPQFNPKRTFEAVVILVVSFGLGINYLICTHNILDWGTTESDYHRVVDVVEPLVDSVKLNDGGFFRMEVNNQRSTTCGNDPMLYGYYGVGHGGSNERNFVRAELFKLGVQWFDMRNYYAQGIPAATDALLGIKYMVADADLTEEKHYTKLTDLEYYGLTEQSAKYELYKSPYALPIAFMANDGVEPIELDDKDLFDNLNRVWSGISGSDRPVFVEEDDIHFRALNLIEGREMSATEVRDIADRVSNKSAQAASAGSDSAMGGSGIADDNLGVSIIMKKPSDFVSSIEFSWIAKKDGPVYVYHRAAMIEDGGSMESLVQYLGTYEKGDTVKAYMTVKSEYVTTVAFEEFAGHLRAAYADLDALAELSEIVRQRPTKIDRIRDSHLTGSFTGAEGQKLLFTIPWDEGWTCTVDGQKAELQKVLGVFMAVDAAPGEHTFEMKYVPAGLSVGMKISLGTLIFTVLYLLFLRKWLDRLLTRKATPRTPQPETA